MPPKKKTSPKRKPTDKLTLPTEDTMPREELHHFMQLWYGVIKIGKTVLARQFPNTLFLFFEEGGKALKTRSMLMDNWVTFRKAVKLLTDTKHTYQNVVVDTGELAYESCMDRVCIEMSIDHPSDEEYGKGWSAVKKEFQKQILALNNSGLGVIINSHEQTKSVKSRGSGDESHRIQPSLSKQAQAVIEPMVDVFAYFHFDENGDRQIQIVGDELVSAGHRLGDDANRFKYTDGTPIRFIPMGGSGKEAYTNFVAAFNNELKPFKVAKTAKKKATKASRFKRR